MVNSLYKYLGKDVGDRFKLVINNALSNTQRAFSRGEKIMHGILYLNEIIHSMKKKFWNKGGLVLKMDFEKAY